VGLRYLYHRLVDLPRRSACRGHTATGRQRQHSHYARIAALFSQHAERRYQQVLGAMAGELQLLVGRGWSLGYEARAQAGIELQYIALWFSCLFVPA
jgi:hypothetical protein